MHIVLFENDLVILGQIVFSTVKRILSRYATF